MPTRSRSDVVNAGGKGSSTGAAAITGSGAREVELGGPGEMCWINTKLQAENQKVQQKLFKIEFLILFNKGIHYLVIFGVLSLMMYYI